MWRYYTSVTNDSIFDNMVITIISVIQKKIPPSPIGTMLQCHKCYKIYTPNRWHWLREEVRDSTQEGKYVRDSTLRWWCVKLSR